MKRGSVGRSRGGPFAPWCYSLVSLGCIPELSTIHEGPSLVADVIDRTLVNVSFMVGMCDWRLTVSTHPALHADVHNFSPVEFTTCSTRWLIYTVYETKVLMLLIKWLTLINS